MEFQNQKTLLPIGVEPGQRIRLEGIAVFAAGAEFLFLYFSIAVVHMRGPICTFLVLTLAETVVKHKGRIRFPGAYELLLAVA